MHFFWSFFWIFLLVQMLTYVVSSMTGASFNFMTGSILAIGVTILCFILPNFIPAEPSEKH